MTWVGVSGADMLSHQGWGSQDKMEAKHVWGTGVSAIPSGRQTYKRGYIQCSLPIGPEGQRPQPARPLMAAT